MDNVWRGHQTAMGKSRTKPIFFWRTGSS